MANLLMDDLGRPVPQYLNQATGLYEGNTGSGGAMNMKLVAGANNIGIVGLAAGVASIGKVTVGTALPVGTNNIGKVDVATLPALPAGTNNIGKVEVLSMPALVGNVALKATLVADTPLQIKATPGIVYKISSALSDVEVRDALVALWGGLGKESFEGGIACNTDITLYSLTGGTVYILYK